MAIAGEDIEGNDPVWIDKEGRAWNNPGCSKQEFTPAENPLVQPQPAPVANDRPAVWDLVIKDMQDRDAEGRRKYGVPLQPHNGRDALVDGYQEALDLVVYLRQEIEERKDNAHMNATMMIDLLSHHVRALYAAVDEALARIAMLGDSAPALVQARYEAAGLVGYLDILAEVQAKTESEPSGEEN